MVKFVRTNGKIGTLFWQVRYPLNLKWLNPLLKRVSSLPETWPLARNTSQCNSALAKPMEEEEDDNNNEETRTRTTRMNIPYASL